MQMNKHKCAIQETTEMPASDQKKVILL